MKNEAKFHQAIKEFLSKPHQATVMHHFRACSVGYHASQRRGWWKRPGREEELGTVLGMVHTLQGDLRYVFESETRRGFLYFVKEEDLKYCNTEKEASGSDFNEHKLPRGITE